MMKLKLEKLEEERKRRELAVELERQKMEEKFEQLKEEHEETLMKHEVAVMNAKAKVQTLLKMRLNYCARNKRRINCIAPRCKKWRSVLRELT